jgi:methylated-DNA-[protein]-cysteine S-methyltransferase
MDKGKALAFKIIDSPTGKLRLIASGIGLVAIQWEKKAGDHDRMDGLVRDDRHSVLVETERQLNEYFAGNRREFDLPLDMRGTHFQKSVWEALLAIPFGETRSYGQIARQLGNANATRAVGAANGQNPIPIVVPCHRVIGSNGTLTGFGGGLETKARLLSLEQRGQTLFE